MARFASNRRRSRFAGAQHRIREDERKAVRESAPARPRRVGTDAGTGPLCPEDPAHGHLLSWSGQWDFYCAHEDHAGWRFLLRGPSGEAVTR